MEIIGKKCVIRADRAGVFFGTVTSKTVTPGGAIEIAQVLGREETLRRMELGLKMLEA